MAFAFEGQAPRRRSSSGASIAHQLPACERILMGRFKTIGAEKRLMEHISLGGFAADPVGQQLVFNFVHTAIRDPRVKQLMYDLEFTINDLAAIYAAMIEGLLPNPCINLGGPMFASTLFFAEPERLESLLIEVRRDTKGLVERERFRVMIERATQAADGIKRVHDDLNGPARFTIENAGGLRSARGCLPMLLVGALVSVLVACRSVLS